MSSYPDPTFSNLTVNLSGQNYIYSNSLHSLNVKDFGATGNGSTDDTAAIQSALNASSSVNTGAVFFPPGIYFVSSTLTIPGNILLYGNDPDRTIIQRTGNYGSTFISGNPSGGSASGSSAFRNLWFNHGTGFYSGSGPLNHVATSGGHIELYGSQNALIDNCYFWRMPYAIIFHGGSVAKVTKNSFLSIWDPTNTSAQEGIALIWFDPTTSYGNPKDFYASQNLFGGFKSVDRPTTYTDSNGHSKTITIANNIGAQSLVQVNGCETFTSVSNYYGAGSLFNLYLNPAPSGFVANVKIVGDLFDSAGISNIRVLSQTTTNPVSHLTLTGVQFNSELNGLHSFDILAQGGFPSLYDFDMVGCTCSATVGASFIITGCVAYRIEGCTFTSYNCQAVTPNSAPIDAQFASAGYLSGPSASDYSGTLIGNTVGGAVNNFGIGNTWLPFYIDASSDAISVRNTMFVNIINGSGNAENGIQEDYPQIVNSNTTLSAFRRIYPCATSSSAITVTLPLNAPSGNEIIIFDFTGTASTYNLTINPNGGTINGSSANYVISTNYGRVRLYNNDNNNWYILNT